jgi:hypothetical protein
LCAFAEEDAAYPWAQTQNNLGVMLSRLGEMIGNPNCFDQALDAFGAALEVFVKDDFPIEWAGTKTNMGNTLESVGTSVGDVASLRRAQAAYKEALEVATRKSALFNGPRPSLT